MRGRCLIAAGAACAICAVALDERDLLRIGALLVALPLLCAALCRASLLRVQVTRSVTPQPLSVGDQAQVELRLRAGSRTPTAGLLISDGVPGDCGGPTTHQLDKLAAGGTATLHYPLAPRQRGRHQLGPLRVAVADPFGLVELVRTVGVCTPVLVRPRVHRLDASPEPAAAGDESNTMHRGLSQAVRDAQLRSYVSGDDMRTIHWPSTARRGELMVRTAEQGRAKTIVVLLDTRRQEHAGSGAQSSFERAISLTASLAAHLQRLGIPVRVLTTTGTQLSPAGAGLDELALLEPAAHADLGAVMRLVGTDGVIAVFGSLDTAAAAALLQGRAGSAHLIQLLPGNGAAELRNAGWTVTEADRATPLSELWASPAQRLVQPR